MEAIGRQESRISPVPVPAVLLCALAVLLALPSGALTREPRCGTPAPPASTLELLAERQRDFEARGGLEGLATVTVVPVHVHVLSSGPTLAEGNVPDSQIDAQITQLNLAFAPRNFQFTLASTTRTVNAFWAYWYFPEDGGPSDQEVQAKTELRRGDRATLNLYTAKLEQETFGRSTWPHEEAGAPLMDGLVVDFRTLPGGQFQALNQGDVAIHEVGHWLGLLHTFEGGCSEPNDHIEDTPATMNVARCPASSNTCPQLPGSDPIHNYMSYTSDLCKTEFTNGQGTRMAVQWAQYRLVPTAPPPCESACGQNQPCDKACRRPDGTDTTCSGWGCCIGNCGGNPSCPGGAGGLAPYCSENCNAGRPCDKLCRLADETCSTCGQYGCCIGNCGGGGNCQGGSGGLAPYCSDACNPNKPCDKVCRLADETCSTCGLYGVCNQGLAPDEGAARLEDRPSCR